MHARLILAAASTLILALGAAPALAEGGAAATACSKSSGDPCKGSNGKLGQQGNSPDEKINVHTRPASIALPMPSVSGRAAFISQIGDANVASIVQTAPDAHARIEQDGTRNDADVTQKGSGTGYVLARQTGEGNSARLQQDGTGQNALFLTQSGTSNWAWSSQTASGSVHNGAVLSQIGSSNDLMLVQNGSDNRAVLTQEGDGNGMTAVQNGDGNRLAWTQQGSGLTDLQITQSGGQVPGGQLQITQTGPGGR